VSGASQIVAVDIDDFKLGLAQVDGRHARINSRGEENLVKTLKKLTGGGVRLCVRMRRLGELVRAAYGRCGRRAPPSSSASRRPKDMTSIRTASLTFEEKDAYRQLLRIGADRATMRRGSWAVRNRPVKLDELITRTYTIDEAPQAFADLEAAERARVIVMERPRRRLRRERRAREAELTPVARRSSIARQPFATAPHQDP
jgi:S-(hydroxymethyl)glutathione dehydrogenase/alcohol dehydrogenase